MPRINGKKAMAFCNKPIRLIPNLGRTNRTSPATSKPRNKIGSTLGLRWWFWLLGSSPSTTLSSPLLPNSLDRNKTNAMASAAMMIKRNMICLHYGKLAVRVSRSIFNSGQKFNHVVLMVAGGGKTPRLLLAIWVGQTIFLIKVRYTTTVALFFR